MNKKSPATTPLAQHQFVTECRQRSSGRFSDHHFILIRVGKALTRFLRAHVNASPVDPLDGLLLAWTMERRAQP
jgi:hypothetical protein